MKTRFHQMGRTHRLSLDDLIRRHEAANHAAVIRPIGSPSTELHVIETRHPAGAHGVPPCDVHRFNVQLSGRQDLIRFDMAELTHAAPRIAIRGTVSFVPAGCALDAVTAGDDFHGFQLLIPQSKMRAALGRVLGDDAAADAVFVGRIGKPTNRIQRLATLLHDEFRASSPGDAAMMAALGDALCIEIARQFAAPSRPATIAAFSEADMAHIAAMMEKAIERDVTIGDIAEAVGLERYQFSRLFRASFGEAPRRHLGRLRLERACRMLAGTCEPLAEIAAACGYASQAHMTTRFRTEIGTTPAKYRVDRAGLDDAR